MSSTIPDGVKQPQDHQKPTVTPVVADDELLRDLPTLTPPHQLRLRQRNRIMKAALRLRSFLPDEDDENADGIDTDDLDEAQLAELLDVLADVDDFAESIAENQAEYVKWAQTAGYEHFTAILSRYSSAVGESSASSN